MIRIKLLLILQIIFLWRQVVYCEPGNDHYTYDNADESELIQNYGTPYTMLPQKNDTNAENGVIESGKNSTSVVESEEDGNTGKNATSNEDNVADVVLEDEGKMLTPVVEQMMANASQEIKNFTDNVKQASQENPNAVIVPPSSENLQQVQQLATENKKPSNGTSKQEESSEQKISPDTESLSSQTNNDTVSGDVPQNNFNSTAESTNSTGSKQKSSSDVIEPVHESLNETEAQDGQNITSRQLNATYVHNSTVNSDEGLLKDLTFMGEIPSNVSASTAVKNLGGSQKDVNNTEYVSDTFQSFQGEGMSQATNAVASVVPEKVPAENILKNITSNLNTTTSNVTSDSDSNFNMSQTINSIDALVEEQLTANSTDKVGNLTSQETQTLNGTNVSNVSSETSEDTSYTQNSADVYLEKNDTQVEKNRTDVDQIEKDLEQAEYEEYTGYFKQDDNFMAPTTPKNASIAEQKNTTSQEGVNKTLDTVQKDVTNTTEQYGYVTAHPPSPVQSTKDTTSQNFTTTQQLSQSDSKTQNQTYQYGSNDQYKYSDYSPMFPFNQKEKVADGQSLTQKSDYQEEKKAKEEQGQQSVVPADTYTVPDTVPVDTSTVTQPPDAIPQPPDTIPTNLQNPPLHHQQTGLETVEDFEKQQQQKQQSQYQQKANLEQAQKFDEEDQTRYSNLQQNQQQEEQEVVVFDENRGFTTNLVIGAVGLFVFVAIVYYGNQWMKRERERQAQYSSLSTYSGEGPLGGGNLPRVKSSGNTNKWNQGWDEGWGSQDKGADEGLLNKRRAKRGSDFV